ncbi:MAG: hypothetical protein JNL67_11945 [Planctomycetaceae bacterium]|nr:hypothetical protein [Planctomycetaceae bacterium]
MAHTIILPYFSADEIQRYVKIVRHIAALEQQNPAGRSACSFNFLLAASPKIEPSDELRRVCEEVAPTHSFQCPTQIFGYPAGPTAMFWDAMDYVQDRLQDREDGFALWLESDMVPVKSNWLDRLDQEWRSEGQTPIVMGCYVPELYKVRLFRSKRLVLHEHINGGACYNKQLSSLIPDSVKSEVFDMVVYREAKKIGLTICSEQIMFSTTQRARRDVMDQEKVLLHGFMQEKDQFVDKCCAPITMLERGMQPWNGLLDAIEDMQRQVKMLWLRRGRHAVLENMYHSKRKLSRQNRRKAA